MSESERLKDINLRYWRDGFDALYKEYEELLSVALEIAYDPKVDLVQSERRIRLYRALRIQGRD